MPPASSSKKNSGAASNPIGDPKSFRGYSTNFQKMAKPEKKSDFLPKFKNSFGGFVIEVAKIVIIALIIIRPVHAFLIQPFYVKGASMEPNFHDQDYLIVDQLSYRLHDPRRGDVVVIHNPFQANEFFIKRIIGLPNETVRIADNTVTITNTEHPNGFVLDETPYLEPNVQTPGNIEVALSADEYYVMGDNRTASLDSRSFGPITRESIVGRTALRAWPIYQARTFQTPNYTPATSTP